MFSIPHRIISSVHPLYLAVAATILLSLTSCRQDERLGPGSETYAETVSAFYTGLAALQVGQDRHAEEQLLLVTERAPEEPAAWANLGLLALRRNEFDTADERLDRARTLAPEESRIYFLSGLLEVARGNADAAIDFFQRARELDSTNLRSVYALAEQIEQRGGAEAEQDVRRLLDSILEIEPNHLAVLIERARRAASAGDAQSVSETMERLQEHAPSWSEESREQLAAVEQAIEAGDLQATATQLTFLGNVLMRETDYRASLTTIRTDPGQPTDLIPHFLALERPQAHPAPPDDSLTFAVEPLFTAQSEQQWTWAHAVPLSAEGLPVVLAFGDRELIFEDGTRIEVPEGLSAGGLILTDYNYDFSIDLGLAGPAGFRLYRQEADSSFTDVTGTLGVEGDLLDASFTGGWSVDVDMEGDLDLVLAREAGPPLVLRNRGDGSFEHSEAFDSTPAVVDFAWADLDEDGDPDAAFVASDGSVHLYENRRSQGFEHRVIERGAEAAAIAVADLDANGRFELVVLGRDGLVQAITDDESADSLADLAQWPDAPTAERRRLMAADVDNNGAIDLVASGGGSTAIWLSHGDGAFERLPAETGLDTYAVADITGGGRLDLVGVGDGGQAVRFANRGSVNYHSKSIRPQAATATGDQRINPFGLGGEIEVRSALLYQKQPISEPIVHFGLGEQLVVDVARIVWPNGDIQAEFDLLSDETVQARQRLKGSCPWLFTNDGSGMRFVTDFIWRSPLGLRINAQETAGVMMTEDWVKIDGNELRPVDESYDLRITAELWETHFFDHVSLMVVDHPAETEVWVDERFAFPPPDPTIHATGKLTPVRKVVDDLGRDVTDFVLEKDERYLASFELGSYQGIAQEHSIIIDLSDAPSSGPLLLLADGWVRPTDSSINVAISQGDHAPPAGLRLDVPDGHGGWRTVHPNLGFPAGKHKTILMDLTDAFSAEERDENLSAAQPNGTRSASSLSSPDLQRVRLTTNLEVYWDRIAWAEPQSDANLRTTRLEASAAELRYRGYSAVVMPDRTHPEVPVYDSLMATVQIWRDLEGYYTRFGDVRELLREVDDRYVIMNAGDELAFRFDELPPPPDGWDRDYVLIGDGWVKDGDYNTTYSETVRPLPAHDLPAYSRPRESLEEDVVYRRHPADWKEYHTRYVAPDEVHARLR